MGDMKGEIQEIADNIAWKEHNCEYYDLSEELQMKVYAKAEAEWNDRQADKADHMLEEAKLEGKVVYGPKGDKLVE